MWTGTEDLHVLGRSYSQTCEGHTGTAPHTERRLSFRFAQRAVIPSGGRSRPQSRDLLVLSGGWPRRHTLLQHHSRGCLLNIRLGGVFRPFHVRLSMLDFAAVEHQAQFLSTFILFL